MRKSSVGFRDYEYLITRRKAQNLFKQLYPFLGTSGNVYSVKDDRVLDESDLEDLEAIDKKTLRGRKNKNQNQKNLKQKNQNKKKKLRNAQRFYKKHKALHK